MILIARMRIAIEQRALTASRDRLQLALDLVSAQLAPFAHLFGPHVVLCGPKLCLNAASAQAIGLALHELASNAGKYGALSKDMGHVDIGWETAGDIFAMSWIERDVPPISA